MFIFGKQLLGKDKLNNWKIEVLNLFFSFTDRYVGKKA